MAADAIRILVYADAHATSPNQRLHWTARRQRNRKAEERARLAWIHAGRPRMEGKVTVDVVIRRGRVLDQDNACACLKPFLDRLFCGNRYGGEAVTADDSPRYLALGTIRQETGNTWKGREEIEFLVRPYGDDEEMGAL